MAAVRWLALACAVAFAGCLEPSVDRPQGSQAVPAISFDRDETGDRVTVIAAEPRFPWERLGVEGDPAGTMARAGGADDAPPIEVVPWESRHPSSSGESLVAGDFLGFCAIEAATGPVTYTLVDTSTDTIVYVTTFQDIAACG